ncbi:MAG: ATP-binding cassette domain-containing protein, partial [Acidimicrobiales bacterium]
MSAIEVEGLTVTYGSVVAVADLSFRAEAGEVTCVLGPNGAGKTSTIESLEGLRRPAAGHLSVIGLDPRTDRRSLVERIGVMLQDGGVHPGVRPLEVLRHAATLYAESLPPLALLERLGLGGLERRAYRQLSGGEQRRLALALALVGRPQVAFLDEPTAGVDPAGRQVIRQVIADLRSEGVTVVLTTHDLDEAERVADSVVIIDAGHLVAEGPLDEVMRGPGAGETVRFAAPPGIDTAALTERLGGPVVSETAPGEYEVAAAPTPARVAAITAWLAERDLPLADLRAGRQRLEDVFLQLTSSGTASGDTEPADPDPGQDTETGEGDPADADAPNATSESTTAADSGDTGPPADDEGPTGAPEPTDGGQA